MRKSYTTYKHSTGMVFIDTTIRKLAPHVTDSVCKVTVLFGASRRCLPLHVGGPRDWSFPDALWGDFYMPEQCGLSPRNSNTPRVFAFHLPSFLTLPLDGHYPLSSETFPHGEVVHSGPVKYFGGRRPPWWHLP